MIGSRFRAPGRPSLKAGRTAGGAAAANRRLAASSVGPIST